MLILASDTSGKHGSIALAKCESGEECDILEVVGLAGGTFSAQLIPQIAALLEEHGFGKGDIGGFSVVSGPGSFTGLRVGLAAIKALAEVLAKPIAAVSLLEALAESSQSQGKILTLLDAGRNEVYVGEVEAGPVEKRLISETLMSREQCLKSAGQSTIVTSDPALVEAAQAAELRVELVAYPRSDVVARIGWHRLQSGQTVSPEELEANYIRRSDAEIFARSNC